MFYLLTALIAMGIGLTWLFTELMMRAEKKVNKTRQVHFFHMFATLSAYLTVTYIAITIMYSFFYFFIMN